MRKIVAVLDKLADAGWSYLDHPKHEAERRIEEVLHKEGRGWCGPEREGSKVARGTTNEEAHVPILFRPVGRSVARLRPGGARFCPSTVRGCGFS